MGYGMMMPSWNSEAFEKDRLEWPSLKLSRNNTKDYRAFEVNPQRCLTFWALNRIVFIERQDLNGLFFHSLDIAGTDS